MGSIFVWYANDKELLGEIGTALTGYADAIEEPTEVESPATLNLDPATILREIWQLVVAFGSIKASLESIKIIVELLRQKANKGKTSKVQLVGPSGITVTLEGSMTPEQITQVVNDLKSVLAQAPVAGAS